MKLTLLTSLYRSADHLSEFCRRAVEAARRSTADFEILLVNDGSPDNSLSEALKLQQSTPQLTVVDLSRNFGHHAALQVGLSLARGEKIFLLDCDLEEEPEWLERFDKLMNDTKADVVYGVQDRREGQGLRKWGGALFYYLFNKLSPVPLVPNLVNARLMTRRYVRALLRHRESEAYLPGLWALTGFHQVPCAIQKKTRSQSTYTLWHRISLFVNALTSFSSTPLVFIFYTGMVILLGAFGYAGTLTFRKLSTGITVEGWASVMVSLWFLGGLIISFVGIIGIYLSRIFLETKRRPRALIREIFRPGTPS